jgi:HSP20 family molecular chaperone IbpA
MTTIARRRNPVADVLNWLESESSLSLAGMGLTPYIRLEDYVEDGTYVLRAEMPGIDPDKDVELNVLDDVLTIRGERKEEQKDRNRHEFHYGSFERTVRLPRGTRQEDIKASYTDGVLEIRVPYEGAEATPTHIPVARPEA